MKKTILLLSAVLGGVLIIGHQENPASPNSNDLFPINTIAGDVKEHASEELKKAFIKDIENFFQNNDLETSLGISPTERSGIEASIKEYLDSYSLDEDKLNEAKASVENLLGNAKGLSAEEIRDKLSKVFEGKQ